MLDFIVKYWLQFIFGIVASALSGALVYYRKQYKKAKELKTQEQKRNLETTIYNILTGEKYQEQLEKIVEKKIDIISKKSDSKDKELQQSLNGIKLDIQKMQSVLVLFFSERFKEYAITLLEKPYIYPDELDNFQMLYDSCKDLGESHVETFYKKVISLPLKNREETKNREEI